MRETFDHIFGQTLDRGHLFDQIQYILQNIFLEEEGLVSLEKELPLIKFSSCETPPFPLSVYMLCPQRADVGKFFYEMVTNWLIPGRKMQIELFFITDFKFNPMEKKTYTIAEAVVRIKDERDYKIIEQVKEAFQREVSLGISSPYHANRLMEMKGVSLDEKTTLIREKIIQLLARFPQKIDYDIFSFLQQFMISSSRQFKQRRSYRTLTRIVCTLYTYFHSIQISMTESETRRYLYSKSMKVKIDTPFGQKSVVGLFVALNFLHRHEVFEKGHLLKAVERYVKGVKIVDESYILHQPSGERFLAFYVEIEKEGGEDFTRDEIVMLQKRLHPHLTHCIEQLVKPVFMPRNEEEVMRYIVTLSRQVQYVKDIPQVVISFEGQLEGQMVFTVVLVRAIAPMAKSIEQIVKNSSSSVKIELEKVKRIGFVRKKYPKEAVVLRLSLKEKEFFKEDHSLNLYKARQTVVQEIEKLFGEIRDFNGGLLAKQMEVYSTLKEALQENGHIVSDCLENFFHSLYPVEFRGIFPLSALVKLYVLFHEALFSEENLYFKAEKEEHNLFILLSIEERELQQAVIKRIEEFKIPPSHLIKLQMAHEGKDYLGYVFLSSNPLEMDIFLKAIKALLFM